MYSYFEEMYCSNRLMREMLHEYELKLQEAMHYDPRYNKDLFYTKYLIQ
jgi:hypothetical protein